MYRMKGNRIGRWQRWLLIGVLVFGLVVGGVWAVRSWYERNLQPVTSQYSKTYFTIETGQGVHEIGVNLQNTGLIRSSRAFESYVRTHELFDKLQAGTYTLSPTLNVQQIVAKLVSGDITRNLLTILPGKTIEQIKNAFSAAGYNQTAIEKAFDPDAYFGHPALASLPTGVSLEGYLYPDSFEKISRTAADTIVRASLDEMNKHLTGDLISKFKAQKLNTFQAITLASLVEREASSRSDRAIIAQVFLSRLGEGMKLESDVTPSGHGSAYDTYLHAGLPPGPISNVSESSLLAVAEPAKTDFLFFVAGDDGTVRFSHTRDEHNKLVQKYCQKRCSR